MIHKQILASLAHNTRTRTQMMMKIVSRSLINWAHAIILINAALNNYAGHLRYHCLQKMGHLSPPLATRLLVQRRLSLSTVKELVNHVNNINWRTRTIRTGPANSSFVSQFNISQKMSRVSLAKMDIYNRMTTLESV